MHFNFSLLLGLNVSTVLSIAKTNFVLDSRQLLTQLSSWQLWTFEDHVNIILLIAQNDHITKFHLITELLCMINKKINMLFTVFVGPQRKIFCLGLKNVPRLWALRRFFDIGKIFFYGTDLQVNSIWRRKIDQESYSIYKTAKSILEVVNFCRCRYLKNECRRAA